MEQKVNQWMELLSYSGFSSSVAGFGLLVIGGPVGLITAIAAFGAGGALVARRYRKIAHNTYQRPNHTNSWPAY